MQITFTGTNGYFLNDAFFDDNGTLNSLAPQTATSTILVLENTDTGVVTTMLGTGFTYSGSGLPTGGTLLSASAVQGGVIQGTITGISWDLGDLYSALEDIQDFNNHQPLAALFNSSGPIHVDASAGQSGFDFEAFFQDLSYSITQPVTFIGTPFHDRFQGGLGDDSISMGASDRSNDYDDTPGNDTINFAGADENTYNYIEFDERLDPVTVTIDGIANTGTVTTGPDINVLQNVSDALNGDGLQVEASTNDDIFNITTPNGTYISLTGLEGDDTYNLSGDGYIQINFNRGDFGDPISGLVANLATGVVSNDGHGNSDQINVLSSDVRLGIRGTDNNDSVLGSDLNDTFIGEQGDDTFDGGAGFDRIRYDRTPAGAVFVDLANQTATGTWDGFAFTDTLINVEEVGGSRQDNDTILGDAADNYFDGRGGDDSLHGGGGRDTLRGNDGNDTLYGGDGFGDFLDGGDGDDWLDTGSSDGKWDDVDAGTGNDTVDASNVDGYLNIQHHGIGNAITVNVDGVANTGTVDKGVNGTTTILDVVTPMTPHNNDGFYGLGFNGTAFDDTFNYTLPTGAWGQIRAGRGNDTYNLVIGDDSTIRLSFDRDDQWNDVAQGVVINLASGVVSNDGTGGQDTISVSGDGRIEIRATNHDDDITGSARDEQFILQAGNDTLDAGDGFDIVSYNRDDMTSGVVANMGTGVVTGAYDGLNFTHTIANVEKIRGTFDFADQLTGDANANEFGGRGGDDTIDGAAGADTLYGEDGNDSLLGGDGDDTLIGGDGDDTMDGGDGIDVADFDINRADATVTSVTGGIQIVSSEGTDLLSNIEYVEFSDGRVVLSDLVAQPGETISGNDSDEALQGGDKDDTVTAGRGDDLVEAGFGNDDVRGDGGNDTLFGGAGNDTLRGGREEDTIYGGEGDDVVRGQKSGDYIEGGDGDDNLKGGGGNDTILGQDGNDFLKGGTRRDSIEGGDGNDKMAGNSFDDYLSGGAGRDIINGGGDNDTINGGSGNDFLKGGSGADVFEFNTGHGADRVADFDVTEDELELTLALANGQSATDIANAAQISGAGVLLDFGNGDTILLQGLTDITGLAAAIDIV